MVCTRVSIALSGDSLADAIARYLPLLRLTSGLRCVTSSRGDILAHLKEESPDILILDVGLPEQNGLETIQAIRKDWPSVAVILIGENEQYRKAAIDAGAVAYLDELDLVATLPHAISLAMRSRYTNGKYQPCGEGE